uniref:Uncharacterized protein n=1 Tax=Panagrolaimus davidi TaxID=227884 RepID=A0A914QHR4_9BILA
MYRNQYRRIVAKMIEKDGEMKCLDFLKKLKNAAESKTDEFETLKSQFLSTTKKNFESPKKVFENFHDDFYPPEQVPSSIEEENANETNSEHPQQPQDVPQHILEEVSPEKKKKPTENFNESTLSTTEVQNGLIKGEVFVGDTSVSIDPSITSSSSQTPIPDFENVTETVKQSIADIISINIDSNITPPVSSPTSTPFSTEAIQELSRTSVKSELEEIDDYMVFAEPPIKKPKTEYNETFAFEHPSTSILKEICKKLNLEYSYDAYKFWGEIIFENILPVSDNIKTHSFKSKNIFACIAPPEKIEEFCTSNNVFYEHIEFIAKYLSCRIGIYENGILSKFGKWENNDNALTLILLLEGELYSVVQDL